MNTHASAPFVCAGPEDLFETILQDKRLRIRIRWAANQLVRSGLFTAHERPDLEQELWIDLWQRLPQYNPAKASLPTFVDRLVRHKQANLIESRNTHKRRLESPIGRVSWDDLDEWQMEDGDLEQLSVQPLERTDEQMDSEWIMNRLSPEDRHVIETITTCSKSEAAHQLGISRATLYRELTRIRYRVDRMLR